MPLTVPLRGRVNAAALERCLDELTRRHEALRTSFTFKDSLRQIIRPYAPIAFSVIEHRSRLLEHIVREIRRPFDLTHAPLLRSTFYRSGEHDSTLLLVTHHIVSDAWSMDLLVRELHTLYRSYESGQRSPLAPLDVQYADWAVWQRAQLEGEAGARSRAFWRELGDRVIR